MLINVTPAKIIVLSSCNQMQVQCCVSLFALTSLPLYPLSSPTCSVVSPILSVTLFWTNGTSPNPTPPPFLLVLKLLRAMLKVPH